MGYLGFNRDKDKKHNRGQPIKCHRCGKSGGTLMKVEDYYIHQDKVKCAIMSMRRK